MKVFFFFRVIRGQRVGLWVSGPGFRALGFRV